MGWLMIFFQLISLFGEYCFTSPKTNGWIPKMMIWKAGDSGLKYGVIFGINSLDFWGVLGIVGDDAPP